MTTRRKDEQGAVAIIFAAVAVILFVLAAMVVDLGFARDTKRQSQNAADAAALAAANALYPANGVCSGGGSSANGCLADAVNAAKDYAVANFGNQDWTGCPTPPTGFVAYGTEPRCISFNNNAVKPTQVRVVMPVRNVKTGLGVLADVENIPVSTAAQARVNSGTTVNCALCFLGDVDSGNADYKVEGASLAVSGNVSLGAQGHMTATTPGSVAVGGTWDPSEGYSPKPVIDINPFADPLLGLTLPVGKAGLTAKSQPCPTTPKKGPTVPGEGPGIYGDVAITGQCDLQPGLYVITGTWSLKNNDILSNLPGGVTLYFTCGTTTLPQACSSSGQAGGQLFGKNGGITVTARTVNPVSGYAIIYDRNNTSSVQLQGNGGTSITGGLYAARAALEYNGNSCFQFIGGPVVVKNVIKANGNKSCVEIKSAVGLKVSEVPGDIGLDQ